MQFVILHHSAWPGRADHYDLLLQVADGESDDSAVLKTFATLENRFPEAGAQFEALADHRRAFLHFEGALTKNRGRVERVDEGELRVFDSSTNLTFAVAGKKLFGTYQLIPQSDGHFELHKIA